MTNKEIYNSLKEKAKTNEDVKQCIEIIDFIEDQRYRLWSEKLDLKDKVELMKERISTLIKENDQEPHNQ